MGVHVFARGLHMGVQRGGVALVCVSVHGQVCTWLWGFAHLGVLRWECAQCAKGCVQSSVCTRGCECEQR